MQAATATSRDLSELLQVGADLEPLPFPTITRATLALFAGSSGDHNPIHIDIDAARAAGMGDVIAHGMLSMAYVSRYVLQWVPQPALRSLDVRFAAVTPVLATPVCSGQVRRIDEQDGRRLVELDLAVRLSDGTVTVTGSAVVELDDKDAPAGTSYAETPGAGDA